VFVDLDDIRIHVTDTGGDGEAVVLLHGWPDTADLWRHQIAALSAAGYRVIAPDLRGQGRSGRPAEVAGYDMTHLVGDVAGLLDRLGVDRAHLVGHDWGAGVMWVAASVLADRTLSATALSVGHPAAFRAAGLAQREKSWYMLLFQFEDVAERWLSDDDFANFRAWSQHPEADEVVRRLSEPGALTASLNLYRANMPPAALLEPPPALPPITAPAMGVWSSGDIALLENGMTDSGRHVAGSWRYERIDGVGHWMQVEAPDAVNALLLDFLSSVRAPASSGDAPTRAPASR
jgi:pimeloyl-ACP methyl ester carboxylesterase